MSEHSIEGTFAVPRCYLPSDRPEYEEVRKLFDRIKWPQAKPRKDFLENRFNAFCTILGALMVKALWQGRYCLSLNASMSTSRFGVEMVRRWCRRGS